MSLNTFEEENELTDLDFERIRRLLHYEIFKLEPHTLTTDGKTKEEVQDISIQIKINRNLLLRLHRIQMKQEMNKLKLMKN